MKSVTELLGRTDLTDVPNEDLAAAIRDITLVAGSREEWSGRLIAELRRRGATWPEVEQTTGIPTGTAHRWAKPHTEGLSETS